MNNVVWLGGIEVNWILKRGLLAISTIYIVVTITFFLIRLMPGNVVDMLIITYMRDYGMTREQAYAMVKTLLDIEPSKPLWQQYLDYIWSLLHGDLGRTMISGGTIPVLQPIVAAIPWTIFILSLSTTISFLLGVGLGMLMAYRRGGLFDTGASTFASIVYAIPNYIMALFLLFALAIQIPIFPSRGSYDVSITPGFNLPFISSVLYHAFLPMMTYVITSVGGWMLAMRSNTIRVLGEDYVIAAEARGLKDRRVAMTYVGRNAILPLFTSLAITLGYMFGGSVLIETYFGYSGIGMIMGLAMSYRDYPLIQGTFIILVTAVIISNFMADLLYGKLDPRVKLGE
ncbi:ABC transporter permease [Candidatus Bathyarchaeota archaeon]|nr:ABC transporter permease [Candidatus Bathyarchaeota archaeon]